MSERSVSPPPARRPAEAAREPASAAPSARSAPPAGSAGEESTEAAMERLRANIDAVDAVLVKLLNQRARWALEIGEVKRRANLPIYQPDREKVVLARVLEANRGPLGADAVRRLFERTIDESRRLERIAKEAREEGGGGEAAGGAAAGGRRETAGGSAAGERRGPAGEEEVP